MKLASSTHRIAKDEKQLHPKLVSSTPALLVNLDRPLIQAGRLFVGQGLHRLIPGATRVIDGFSRLAGDPAFQEMVRELAQMRLDVGPVGALARLGDPALHSA